MYNVCVLVRLSVVLYITVLYMYCFRFADGTFQALRPPMTQLFSIHAFVEHDDSVKQIPLVFVLMTKRRKRDYRAVFKALKQAVPAELKLKRYAVTFCVI